MVCLRIKHAVRVIPRDTPNHRKKSRKSGKPQKEALVVVMGFERRVKRVCAHFFQEVQAKSCAQNLRAELLLDNFQHERKMCLCLTVSDLHVNRTCIVFSMPCGGLSESSSSRLSYT